MADGTNNDALLARMDERTGQIQKDISEIKEGMKANAVMVQQHEVRLSDLEHWRTAYDKLQAAHAEDVKRLAFPFLNWLLIAVVVGLGSVIGAYLTHLLH